MEGTAGEVLIKAEKCCTMPQMGRSDEYEYTLLESIVYQHYSDYERIDFDRYLKLTVWGWDSSKQDTTHYRVTIVADSFEWIYRELETYYNDLLDNPCIDYSLCWRYDKLNKTIFKLDGYSGSMLLKDKITLRTQFDIVFNDEELKPSDKVFIPNKLLFKKYLAEYKTNTSKTISQEELPF